MKPLIGLTCNHTDAGATLADGYWRSIAAAGGVPVLLPPLADADGWRAALDAVDAVVLTGGSDINPLLLGEDPVPALGSVNPLRDAHELPLVREAVERGMPVLGICRGVQVMAAALGGSLVQDIPSAIPACLKHSQDAPRPTATHRVAIRKGSVLEKIFGESLDVNSFHHQSVRDGGEWFMTTAQSKDGVVEALEGADGTDLLGVQWHPECFLLGGDGSQMPLFRHFVSRAAAYRRGRRILERIPAIDTHCDAPMKFADGARIDQRDAQLLTDVVKMREGRQTASVIVAYIPQGGLDDASLAQATARADRLLDLVEEQAAACTDVVLARCPEDVRRAHREGRIALVRGIENGYALGNDLSNVARYAARGIAYLTLCHNGDNQLCDSARRSLQTHGGLSPMGREAVRLLNEHGVMVDLSHAAESTFYQVLEASRCPVICSHSSARALCSSPRNLTDAQLRALSEAGGVAGITLYPGFLADGDNRPTVRTAVQHAMHMISVAGIDHVCFGSDFDGDGGVQGLGCSSALPRFAALLLEEGLSEADLRKLFADNFLRVWAQAQALAGNL